MEERILRTLVRAPRPVTSTGGDRNARGPLPGGVALRATLISRANQPTLKGLQQKRTPSVEWLTALLQPFQG